MNEKRSHRDKGTYALVLALDSPREMQVGSLGMIRFDSPYYLYIGSAFGPGGLQARIKHHLAQPRRPHWHLDYLRQEADVVDVWYAADPARLECIWAAMANRELSPVPHFGSSDCRCQSHLFASRGRPTLAAFRRDLGMPDHRPPLRAISHTSRPLSFPT